MNNSNFRESEFMPKEEDTNGGKKANPKPNLTTSSWTKLKDPRIVRVSRAFGGKDRHSKVYTVRGLRDRRVRLSVPTAIQLYDLQDRLGLSQPSKVVDWLLDMAKHEIDELPPLQIPSGPNFVQGFQSMINVASQSGNNLDQGVKSSDHIGLNWEDYWHPNKSVQSSNQSPSLPLMFNNEMAHGSFLKLNPANLSLSQFGSYGSMASTHNFNINETGSQILVYPPPYHDHSSRTHQFDPKQLSFGTMSSSSTSSHNPLSSPLYAINQGMIRPFQLNMHPKSFNSEEEVEQDKRN